MNLQEIAVFLGDAALSSGADPEIEITGARGLQDAQPGDISFLKDKKHLNEALQSGASCVLVREFHDDLPCAQIRVADPYHSFALLLARFNPLSHGPAGVSDRAFVAGDASLGSDVTVMPMACVSSGATIGARTVIYPGVFVGAGVSVGEDCVLWPSVVLRDGSVVGNRVIIHPGVVIGADGFGYIPRPEGHFKVPQVGGVTLEDDVEIGANTTIDRATTGMTVIGRGTKIDNLVQIGHNVIMGRACIVVAGTVIGGSCKIGDGVVFGGQCAIRDNVTIASGTMLAGRTGVADNLSKGIYGGTPAFSHKKWIKSTMVFEQLPELLQRVRELEQAIGIKAKENRQ